MSSSSYCPAHPYSSQVRFSEEVSLFIVPHSCFILLLSGFAPLLPWNCSCQGHYFFSSVYWTPTLCSGWTLRIQIWKDKQELCQPMELIAQGHLDRQPDNYKPACWELYWDIKSARVKSKLQWGITSHESEWPLLKSRQITNAGKGVEEREPSYTVGGSVSWCSHYGKQYGVSSEN